MEEAQGGYEYEGELDSAVAPALEEYGIAVFRELGEPPDLINISPQFWETASQILIIAIAPILAKVFRNIAIRALGDDVDLSLIDQTAADWARQYTFALVKDINLTTMQALQRIISGFFEKPTTMGELQAQILKIIGSPARANTIAVTEVTRAVSEAELFLGEVARGQPFSVPVNAPLGQKTFRYEIFTESAQDPIVRGEVTA